MAVGVDVKPLADVPNLLVGTVLPTWDEARVPLKKVRLSAIIMEHETFSGELTCALTLKRNPLLSQARLYATKTNRAAHLVRQR